MTSVPETVLRVLGTVLALVLVRDGYAGLRGRDLVIPHKGHFSGGAARLIGAVLVLAGTMSLCVAWVGFW